MKMTSVRFLFVWLLVSGLSLQGVRSACGQATSPLTVSGTTFSQLKLIKTNAPARTIGFTADASTFALSVDGDTVIRIDGGPINAQRINSDGRVAFSTTTGFETPL